MAIEWDPLNFDGSTDIIGIPREEQVETGLSPRNTGPFSKLPPSPGITEVMFLCLVCCLELPHGYP
jgi:hypothetical protein